MSATNPRPTNPSVFGQLASFAYIQARRSPSNFSMPAHTIREMEIHGIDRELIDTLFGPRSKITRLYKTNENLDQDRTDRAVRVLRIVDLAERIFKNRTKAMAWLKLHNEVLSAKPLDMLTREAGANLVEEALLRISHGVLA